MDKNIDNLIVRYYCGTLDDKGAEILASWVSSDKEAAREFKSRLRALQNSGVTTSEATAFLAGLKKRKTASRWLWAGSASIAVLGLVAVVMLFGRRSSPAAEERQLLASQTPVEQHTVATTILEKTDGQGQSVEVAAVSRKFAAPKDRILPVTLDDGTSIMLNKGTKLTVDPDFGKKTRTVTLDGEAFFEVARNTSKPFSIICRDEQYIVHGTSFNIQSFARDGYSMVTLHTGSLEARVKGSKILLDPGDELFVDESEENFTKKKVNTAYSSMWMNDGTLHFSGLALKYVAAQLSHKYGVNVSVHASVANILYEGEIDNEPLDTALKLISISAPTKLKITNLDGEYYITKR